MSEILYQCPLLESCKSIAKMQCDNRDFTKCDFFKRLLGDYCEKNKRNCDSCIYKKYFQNIKCSVKLYNGRHPKNVRKK